MKFIKPGPDHSFPTELIAHFDISFCFIHFELMVLAMVSWVHLLRCSELVWKLQIAVQHTDDLNLFLFSRQTCRQSTCRYQIGVGAL